MAGRAVIVGVRGREVLDACGGPALEVTVRLESGAVGRACLRPVPGQSPRSAAHALETAVGDALVGCDAGDQAAVDGALGVLGLGAGASLASARAAAAHAGMPLWRWLDDGASALPVPMLTLLDGSAGNALDVRELMVVPWAAESFADAVRVGVRVYWALGDLLAEVGALRSVGATGAFAPNVPSVEAALELAETAIERAGHRPGEDVALAVDAGAARWRFGSGYRLATECLTLSGPALVARWADLAEAYPIAALIDPLGSDDPDGWAALRSRVGHRVQVVGGVALASSGLASAVTVGLDGVATLSSLLELVAEARAGGCGVVLSRAPAETEDPLLADLAVGLQAGQIRAGGPCRGECTAKYNRLLRIEEALGDDALYAGHAPFRVRVR
ncbi:MAG TPA: hypothetical protein VNS09_20630 [Solirubrobacter sp.]|nr:hypothetical protein [Solirubrobacter sp.]